MSTRMECAISCAISRLEWRKKCSSCHLLHHSEQILERWIMTYAKQLAELW